MYHSLSDSALRDWLVPDQRMSASTSEPPRALNCRRIAILPRRNASAASSACFIAAKAFSLSASAKVQAACSAAFVNVGTPLLLEKRLSESFDVATRRSGQHSR